MAGETIKGEAICLAIHPWSKTSHIVTWLTPNGRLSTLVKGAERPKSPFLGQYDLNYTCELVYYARTRGDLHVLRECVPVEFREPLRSDFRALAVAGYFRRLAAELCPAGPEGGPWFELLGAALDRLMGKGEGARSVPLIEQLLQFELKTLELSGLAPDFSGYDPQAEWSAFGLESGSFANAEGRQVRISREVAEYLTNPRNSPKNSQIPLDAARVVGVFYQFHLDHVSEVRRSVLGMI